MPVVKVKLKNKWGAFQGASYTPSLEGSKIVVSKNTTPQRLFSTLMHEGTHALQFSRPIKGSNTVEVQEDF